MDRSAGVRVGVAAAVILAACASSGPRRDAEVAQRMLRKAGNPELVAPRDDSEFLIVDTVPLSPEQAFARVPDAYRTLGLRLSYYDPDARELGVTVPRLGRLEGQKPSNWLDCGRGATATPYADQYQVTFSIATRVLPTDGGSTVESVVRARARPLDVLADWIRCTSRRTLEPRIVQLVLLAP